MRQSRTAAILPILFLSGLALFQAPVETQERAAKPARNMALETAVGLLDPARTDGAVDRLGSRLKFFRTVGDLENAGRLFARLFPSDLDGDVEAAAKTAGEPLSNRVDNAAGNVKEMPRDGGGILVYSSVEHEKAPSLDLLCSGDETPEIFIGAEQWSDGWPKNIRIRKSSDDGLTWPETVVIGDDHPWTQPSLRQISDDAIGIAFVKHRDGDDRDIYFARLSKDLDSDAEFPVAFSRVRQDNPALASDHPAFSAPYIYIVYAEHEGDFHSIKFRVSRNLGASWSRPVTVASFSGPAGSVGETALAYDPDQSALHVAYTCPQGSSTGIAVSSSLSFGARWSTPVFVTPSDDSSDSCPKIAAAGGTVLVAYERTAGAFGRDIGLAYSISGGRQWTTGGSLASSAADKSAPDLRASVNDGFPRIFASYVKDSAQIIVLSCNASSPGSWTPEQVIQDRISVVDGGPVAVLPMLDPQGEVSAGVAWSGPNPDYDVYFGSAWLQSAQLLAGRLSVQPSGGLTSTGNVGGPFSPASTVYALQNTGDAAIGWTATKTQTWTTLSSTSGTLNAGATTTVTVSINAEANALAAGTYNDTVRFTNTTNGNGNANRQVSLTINVAPGSLSVIPVEGLVSTGYVGGPFNPASKVYTLQNTGGTAIAWTAAKAQAWTTLSSTSGTLSAGATATVTVSINAGANALAPGTYNDTVSFTNTTNGSGTTTRPVSLTINEPPGSLSVTPGDGLMSTGFVGGPFSPTSQAYILQNTGGTAIAWTAAKTQAWTTLSAVSGSLNPGASVMVTASINAGANALAAGTYNDTVSFTNTTNGNGTTTRPVSLTVSASPVLSVTPDNRDVGVAAGTTTFEVANSGAGTMDWSAAVIAGGEWLFIQSGASGTNGGMVTVGFTSNQTAWPRQGIVRVSAAGAVGSPKYVTVTQASGSVSLGLSGQRLIEKAWIVQREYGKLTVTVDNPASIVVDTYVIYRNAGGQGYLILQQLDGSSLSGAQWNYNDTFLEPGTNYTYKIVAVDALGNIIGESNEISI
jgi:hypothetical protein